MSSEGNSQQEGVTYWLSTSEICQQATICLEYGPYFHRKHNNIYFH